MTNLGVSRGRAVIRRSVVSASSPSVSVIIPTFNRAALIGETLECMLRQTLEPHEIIVVDDGSDDDTARVVRLFGARIKFIEQNNAGPGAARNTGLAVATGEFVQFFDSDDLCTLDKLEKQAAALVANGSDIAYSAWTQAWFDGRQMRLGKFASQQYSLSTSALSAYLRGWLTFMQACLFRRRAVIAWGGFPAHSKTGEDLELLFRAIIAGAQFTHVAGPIVLLRQHPNNQISAAAELSGMRAEDMVRLTQIVSDLVQSTENSSSPWDRLMWQVKTWQALRDRAAIVPKMTPVPAHPVYAAISQIQRLARGLQMRRYGYREESFFGCGIVSDGQYDAIRELGYEPVKL